MSVVKSFGFWIVATSLAMACSSASHPEPRRGSTVEEECPPKTSDRHFIPDETIDQKIPEARRSTLRQRYSIWLTNGGVSPLWCGRPTSGRTFRLLWVPAGRPTRLIEVTEESAHWSVRDVVFGDGLKGQDVHRVATARSGNVNAQEGTAFAESLARARIWTASSWVEELQGRNDGVEWIAEARSDSIID
jgi:hypothetical protein